MLMENATVMNTSSVGMNATTSDCSINYEAVCIARDIQKYSKPVICLFGFIGNFLSAAIFLSKTQRKTSCSLYLGARSLSDTGFLISLFFIWLGDMHIDAFKAPGLCQSVIFLSYVCAFLSVWFIVIVTFENYIRICMPFRVNLYCTTKKAKIIISVFTLISFIIYNFTLWTFTVTLTKSGMSDCSPYMEFADILQYLYYVDTIVTLLLPMLIIVILMLPITFSLLEFLQRQALMTGKSKQERRQNNPQSKVTKLLFSVSLVFIFLSLPSHVVRIQLTIATFVAQKGKAVDRTVYAIKYIFETIYYSSFAVNIVIYLLFGDKFRNDFKNKFCSRFLRRKEQASQTQSTLNNTVCRNREESCDLLGKKEHETHL